MHIDHHLINDFSVEGIISDELPFMSEFYGKREELKTDIRNLFQFPLQHAESGTPMPFYVINDKEYTHIEETFNGYTTMMHEALRMLFTERNSEQLIRKFFDCEFIRKYGEYFVPYAQHTWRSGHFAMYGRYDAAFDPSTGKITGVYELNADTPTMLFESTILQNAFTQMATEGNDEPQFNQWYPEAIERVKKYIDSVGAGSLGKCAVVCDTNYVEDTSTSEVMAQVMHEINGVDDCVMIDLKNLDFDLVEINKPFCLSNSDHYFDTIFILSPWEEMIPNCINAFKQWDKWVDQVRFVEPAWRWFLSNKGMMAFITHLMDTNVAFWSKYKDLPHLRTYLSPEKFIAEGKKFVSKPKIGRMSANIIIHDEKGNPEMETAGEYSGEEVVYQEYCKTHNLSDAQGVRNNFLMCMWLAPYFPQYKRNPDVAATLAFREFNMDILDANSERFIPHLIKD